MSQHNAEYGPDKVTVAKDWKVIKKHYSTFFRFPTLCAFKIGFNAGHFKHSFFMFNCIKAMGIS